MNKLTRTDNDEFLKIYNIPEKCRKFLQDVGIIGEDLKLTQPYLPDKEADSLMPGIMRTFNDIKPSKDLNDLYYDHYLEIASQEELENDVVTQQTYYNICRKFNISIPKPNPPKSKLLRPL